MRLRSARLRKLAIRAVLLGLALLGVALLSLWLFFDPIARLALAPVTRDLKGELDFDDARLEWGRVVLDNVRLDSAQDGRVLEAPRMEIELEPLAYLGAGGDSARLLGDMVLVRPILTLRVDSEGHFNLARLFVPRPGGKPWLARYDGRIRILDGTAFYRDERRGLFVYKAGFEGDLAVGPGEDARLHLAMRPEQSEPGSLRVSGWVGREVPELDLRFEVERLELKPMTGFPPLQRIGSLSEGTMSGDAWARGRSSSFSTLFRELAWGGSLEVRGAAMQAVSLPWTLRGMQGTAVLLGNSVHLNDVEGTAGNMPFRLRGEAFFSPRLWLDVLAVFPRLNAARLRELSPRAPVMRGDVALELAVEGPPDAAEIRGTIRSARLASGGHVVRDLHLSFRLHDEVLQVDDVRADAVGGRVRGEGFVLLHQEAARSSVLLDVQGDRAALDQISPGLEGEASFRASVLGTWRDPLVNGQGEIRNFSGLGQALDFARARFFYGGQMLMLRGGSAQQGGARLEMPAALLDLRDRFVAASLQADGMALPPTRLQGKTVTGTFSGRGFLWGLWDKPASLTARGVFQNTRLALGGLSVVDLAGEFLFSDRMVYLPGVTGNMEGGALGLAGRYDLSGRSTRLALEGERLPGDVLRRLLGVPVTFRDPIDARVLYLDTGRESFEGVALSGQGNLAVSGARDDSGRLEAVAWADRVELGVFGLGAFRRVADDFSGVFALSGPPRAFDYTLYGHLHGNRLALRGPVDVTAWGRRAGTVLALDKAILSWDYPATRQVTASGVTGQAYPFPGPIFGQPLQRVRLGQFQSPGWGLLSLSGTIDLASRATNLRYRAEDFELGWLASRPWLGGGRSINEAVDHAVAGGVADATGTIRGSYFDPIVSAQVDVPWMALEGTGAPMYSARGRLSGTKRWLAFEPLWVSDQPYDGRRGQGPGLGLMEVRGRVAFDTRRQPSDLVLSTRGFDAQAALALLPPQVGGSLSRLYGQVAFDRLRLSGPLGRPSLAGQLQLRRGGIPFQDRLFPLDSLLVDFSSREGSFAISNLELLSGQLRMQGRGTRTADGRYVANLWSQDVPMTYLHNLGVPFTALSGVGDLALRLQAGGGRPVVFVGLEAEQLVWSTTAFTGQPADPITLENVLFGRFERQPDGSLLTGPGLGVELSATGTRGLVDIPAEAVRLETGGATLGAQGTVSLQAPAANEEMAAWFRGPRGPDFGNARTGPFQARMENFAMSQLAGLLGMTDPELEARVSGTLSLEGQWYRDLETLGVARLPRYSFEARALELAREVDARRVALSLAEPATLTFERDGPVATLRLTPARLAANGGYLEAAGQLVLAGALPSAVTATARDLPLETLALLSPRLADLRGSLQQMDFSLAGPLPAPALDVSFQAQRAPEGQVQLGLQGSVTGRPQENGGYLVDFGSPGVTLAIGSAAERLTLGGQIPLRWVREAVAGNRGLRWAWEGLRMESGGEMSLSARIDDQNMQLIDTLIPQVTRASGRVQGNLDVTGTVEAPTVVGGITIENGNLQTTLMEDPIANLNVVTRFEQISPEEAEQVAGAERYEGMFRSRYSIDRFEGMIGTHPFTVTGKAEMAGFEPTFLNLALSGAGIPIRQERFRGNADLALTLEARPGRTRKDPELHLVPVLTGQVSLPDGDLYLNLSDTQQGLDFPVPVRYDVDLALGDNFWVHVGDSRVRAQGQLKLQPDSETGQPVLSGSAFLSRGVLQIPFYSVSFNIRQGWAYWDRSLIPTLENVEADTTIGTYQIVARVDGTYPDLKVELFSNPPLAQAELVRLVAVSGLPGGGSELGSTNIAMDNFLQSQGLAVLSGLVANPITQQLSKVLFLSEVSFDYQLPATYVVKLAKALDAYDRILLTLTRIMYGNGLSESLYGLEYRFQPNLLTRVALDDLGQLRFWFQGIFSWW